MVEMTIDRTSVALLPNASQTVTVTGGNGDYKAVSSSDAVAKATVNGNVVTITATSDKEKAHALIVITDKYFKRQTVDVDVAKLFDLTLSATDVALEANVAGKNEVTITINSGNGGYKTELVGTAGQMVELNTTKLASHGKFTIKATAAGSPKIMVTDAKGKEVIMNLTITAPPAITLSKTQVDLSAVQGSEEITVTAGSGGYTLKVANPLVAKVYVNDNKITVKGKANGTTSIAIEDKKGQKATLNVKVAGGDFAMNFTDQYFAYANFGDIAIVDQTIKSVKKVTFEMNCRISGYRGLQTFMGLEGNLIIRGKNDDFRPTHPIQIVGLGDRITLETTKSFNLNEWLHIALVVDCDQTDVAQKYKFYINGVQDPLVVTRNDETHTSINLASSSDGNRFEIGRSFGQDFRALRGIVSEARVWTVARTAQEVSNNMCVLTGSTTGLLARWNFTAGVETGYIQDTNNGGKYETNLILANAKLGGNYTQLKVSASVFVSKGCPQ
ncbi:LamG domain-containing protein [Mucilaginibacter myungsuensis]